MKEREGKDLWKGKEMKELRKKKRKKEISMRGSKNRFLPILHLHLLGVMGSFELLLKVGGIFEKKRTHL